MSGGAAQALTAARPLAQAQRRWLALAVPAGLFALAAAINLLAAGMVSFPANEGSAYYVTVARNIAAGRGLVIDAVWSYATPPLVLPRPAFELWQPLASFIAAAPMVLLGSSFASAQLGGALLGALLAPLAWLVGRDAARAIGLTDGRRLQLLGAGSGMVVALSGPLLAAVALPDSTIPFTVAAVGASLLFARTLAAGRPATGRWALALGAGLGLAWLARHEAIWLGLAVVALAASSRRFDRRLLGGLLIGGLLVAGPWLARNLLTFGTPLPGQTIDNLLLTSNEQIFGWAARPTLEAFLGQGAGQIAANIATGTLHNLVFVLLVPAAPLVGAGLATGAWLWLRHRRRLAATALAALLLSGVITFAVASLAFPIASRWGTFQHAAGPLVVGLAVAGVIGLDQLVTWVGRRRGWQRANTWLAPLALAALSLPLSGLLLVGLAREATAQAQRIDALAGAVRATPELAGARPQAIITDHP
ncbi:MAG TPA: hypothetical protein VH741_00425, partial [Candidatus Limnocylindrales bacterium]